jgi:hypothetical protein
LIWAGVHQKDISATAVTETPETVVSQEVKRTGTMPPPTPEPPRQVPRCSSFLLRLSFPETASDRAVRPHVLRPVGVTGTNVVHFTRELRLRSLPAKKLRFY